jgi:hypothetical protein
METGIFVIKIDLETLANYPGKELCEILDWVKDQIIINKRLRGKIMYHGNELGSFDVERRNEL